MAGHGPRGGSTTAHGGPKCLDEIFWLLRFRKCVIGSVRRRSSRSPGSKAPRFADSTAWLLVGLVPWAWAGGSKQRRAGKADKVPSAREISGRATPARRTDSISGGAPCGPCCGQSRSDSALSADGRRNQQGRRSCSPFRRINKGTKDDAAPRAVRLAGREVHSVSAKYLALLSN